MGLNADKMVERAKSRQSSDSLYFKLIEGRNVLRVLPRSLEYFSKKGDTDFAFMYHVHYRLFDVDGYRAIVCKKTAGEKCPICDHGSSLNDKAKEKTFRATERYVYNILDYESGLIKIFESGPFIYDEILKYIVDPAWGDMFGTKDGRDIVIEREAMKSGEIKNPYKVKMVPDRTDITDGLPENWDERVDSLRERIPDVKEDAFYLGVAEHLRAGTIPSPISRDSNAKPAKEEVAPATKSKPASEGTVAKSAEAQPEPAAVEETTQEKRPECFGLEYAPRAENCKTCTHRSDCRDETLKL